MRKSKQIPLPLKTWGGKRDGAGRKPVGSKAGVPHRSRLLAPQCPLHVTLRVRRDVPYLRRKKTWKGLREAFAKGRERFGFRLNEASVQGNHLHFIVEAEDAQALGRGMKGLGVRIARGVNRLTGHRGRVVADRYHSRPLATPTEVRNALRYVLDNARIHAGRRGQVLDGFDPYSTAQWFTGWRHSVTLEPDGASPTAAPKTWLLKVGWRHLGLL